MADEIKEGLVVQLKSGGPKMTVKWVGDEYGQMTAICDWFIQDKAPWKKDTGRFAVSSLKIVPD